MNQTTKTVEQLLTFLAQKLSPSVHQVFAIYERMVVIGAWERIGFSVVLVFVGLAMEVWLSARYRYEVRHSGMDEVDFGGYMTGWILLGVAVVIGAVIGVAGIGYLLDPPYRVIQLLLQQAT